MAKFKWSPEAVLEEVKRVMKLLDIDVIPKYEELRKHSTCTAAFARYGGIEWASMKLGVPHTGTGKFKWREETLLAEVKRIMDLLELHDRLPTYEEFDLCSTCWNSLWKIGGVEGLSEKMGLPFIEEAELVHRPSAAFEKVKKTRKRYSEIQIEDSLKLAGKIDVSKYAGMKTWKERMEEKNEEVGAVQRNDGNA